MSKKNAVAVFIAFSIAIQPAPAYAGFFLFNIIHDIFNGGHKTDTTSVKHSKTSNTNGSSAVKYGMRNNQVAVVQQYLIKAEYLGGKADGIFGNQTLQAVKEFQRDCGLAADGIVGTRTMNALEDFKSTRPKKKPPARKPITPPPNDSGTPHYLYTLPMLATAYTAEDEGCTGITYRGHVLQRGMVAVDPDVIPLGTRLYVPGYGEAVADDIGGAITGNHIDLAMDTIDEAFNWGRREVTVYILPRA